MELQILIMLVFGSNLGNNGCHYWLILTSRYEHVAHLIVVILKGVWLYIVDEVLCYEHVAHLIVVSLKGMWFYIVDEVLCYEHVAHLVVVI